MNTSLQGSSRIIIKTKDPITVEKLNNILGINVPEGDADDFIFAAKQSETAIDEFQKSIFDVVVADKGCSYRAARTVHCLRTGSAELFRGSDCFKRWNIKCKETEKNSRSIPDVDKRRSHLTVIKAFPKTGEVISVQVKFSPEMNVGDVKNLCAGQFNWKPENCLISIANRVIHSPEKLSDLGISPGTVLLCDGS